MPTLAAYVGSLGLSRALEGRRGLLQGLRGLLQALQAVLGRAGAVTGQVRHTLAEWGWGRAAAYFCG